MDATRTKTTVESAPRALESRSFETHSASYVDHRGRSSTALFRLYDHDAVAVLQHTRHTEIDAGPTPSSCTIDTDPALDDVDARIRDELRADGYTLVTGGSA
jgi:hypothetical protein